MAHNHDVVFYDLLDWLALDPELIRIMVEAAKNGKLDTSPAANS